MSETTQEPVAIVAPVEAGLVQGPLPMTSRERRKKQLKQEMEEAQLFQQLGQRVIKVKTRTLQAIGEHLHACGIRAVGHGRIVVAGENADKAFGRCAEVLDKLMEENPMVAKTAIIEVLQLQAVFNRQILEAGEAHLKADRQPESPQKGLAQMQAFPPGGAVIVVNASPAPQSHALLPPPP